MSKLARPITPDEVAAYREAGVVLLRGIIDLQTVNALRRSIDEAVSTMEQSPAGYNLSQLTSAIEAYDRATLASKSDGQHNVAAIAEHILSTGKPFLKDDTSGKGSFLLDTGLTARLREFRRFTLNGPGPEISAALLGGEQVNFFGDQIFVKEPGTSARTAFHQDATYFEIDGDQCCVLWIPVDPVPKENGAMLYWRGSHKTGTLYQPNVFVSQAPLPGAQGEVLPDIENNLGKYDIVHFDVEPGDIIVHHYRTVHGAGGNTSRYQVRRAASLRYCGDDIRVQTRPWAPRQLHHTTKLNEGDPLGGPDFPVVWRRRWINRQRDQAMNFFELEQLQMKRGRAADMQPQEGKADIAGLTAMLDYAIVEGAQMRLPLFVCLLRLARMALKEETEGAAERKPEVNA